MQEAEHATPSPPTPPTHGKHLADKLVELPYIDGVSHEKVRQVLKKNQLKPWLTKRWCIHSKANGEFVWRMEDILSVCSRPCDPLRPPVCLDVVSKQLIGETRCPRPMQMGRPARYDYEYARNGTANLFLITEPLRGWRHVTITERGTRIDWAHVIRDLVDVHYPEAEKIVLVMYNLNTHSPGSLYEAFPPAEAKRLADKLEIHYTPKHGSWLNIAEIELSVLSRQCLDRRIPDRATLAAEVAAWQDRRHAAGGTVDWQFTTEDARLKLKHLYPKIQQ